MSDQPVISTQERPDRPTQLHIRQAIILFLISAALLFIPSLFKSIGATLFDALQQYLWPTSK